MNALCTRINGHRVVSLAQQASYGHTDADAICAECGAHFAHRLEIEYAPCPGPAAVSAHDLVIDSDDGLLYCRRCPMVAYDLNDADTETVCPLLKDTGTRRT